MEIPPLMINVKKKKKKRREIAVGNEILLNFPQKSFTKNRERN